MAQGIKDVKFRIREFRRMHNIAKSRLADMAGVSEGILRGMDEDDWNPTSQTLEKLEVVIPEAFEVKPVGANRRPQGKGKIGMAGSP
jgi:ribosome-binding protein aMBF1 (putative translation factor)